MFKEKKVVAVMPAYNAAQTLQQTYNEVVREAVEELDNKNPCSFCGARQSLRLYLTYSMSGENFYLNRCLTCRAVFLNPRPTQQRIDRAYNDAYYGIGEGKFAGCIEKVLNLFRRARAVMVTNYIKPPARILDIGCGNGRFLNYMIKQGFDCYGVELPGKAAEMAGKIQGLNLKVGRMTCQDYGESFFDGVCMWHVFEHLTEPKETLHIIQKILKPGGYLMMSLPNIDSVQSRLFRGKWFHLDPPKHLFFTGASDLISEMQELGFKLIRHKYFSLEQNPFGIQQSILNCFLRKRDVFFESLKGNNEYIKEYSRFSIILQRIFYLSTFPVFALLSWLEAAFKKGGTMEFVFKKEKT
jgi:2-polyprenyl-3-methyl-5-hydroxy-6-metoxy-1,4-benzoquinol methylase